MMETLGSSLLEFNGTRHNGSTDFTSNTSDLSKNITENFLDQLYTNFVYTSVITSIELPMICLAIRAIYYLKSGRVAPVFVINLLISDLLQIVCSFFIDISIFLNWSFSNGVKVAQIALYMWFCGILTNLYFMTCIAVERYLLIAHSVWHKSHQSVKCLWYTSLAGWLVSAFLLLFRWAFRYFFLSLLCAVIVVAYVVIVFCFARVCRILSHSKAVTSLKKWFVLATLLLVLLSYTFTVIPYSIALMQFLIFNIVNGYLFNIGEKLLMLNPLVDCVMYVFLRRDAPGCFRHCRSRKKIKQSLRCTTVTDLNRV
nr:C-C chemokine receptor type 4-like [Misgurnus anguillicaudatus]